MRKPAVLLALIILSAAGVAGHPASRHQPHDELPAAGEPQAGILHEVRLRKMHSLRPELIPYPTFQAYFA